MKYFRLILLFFGIGFITSCADYLDIVPEGTPTMDNAFSNRVNTEKFLFTCFSYLPNPVNVSSYPALVAAGDEMWVNTDHPAVANGNRSAIQIASGYQNTNDPYLNYWGGRNDASNLFIAIRDCNIFLENIHRPWDIEEWERIKWAAEVKFLKAYYHFFLLQLYGPIPIVRENIPVNATPDEVRVYREPVDDVVDYIVELLDEAVKDLPLTIDAPIMDAGRITQAIALAVKAKALVWAASPLFNGNQDYTGFKDNKGRQLISSEYDASKWQRAAVAASDAIETCHQANHSLFRYSSAGVAMSDTTKLKYTIRGAVSERVNPETVWPSAQTTSQTYQKNCFPRVGTSAMVDYRSNYSGTLKVAEQYYTVNGIPINEDPDWDYDHRYETQAANGTIATDHRYYIQNGQTTAKLNFYREPRFYASLCFDRGIYEGAGQTEANSYWLSARAGEAQGLLFTQEHIITGYFIKKIVNRETVTSGTSYQEQRYLFPVIRLADLYLLYAEALNETKSAPDVEVYHWIDLIRERAGLKGVVESWAQSSVPNKPLNKDGMREIIKQERLIELAFEGQRFFDLRRWKDALRYYNEPLQGWDYQGTTTESYYTVTTYLNSRVFNTKDYLWPLRNNDIIINSNLVQSPGWK